MKFLRTAAPRFLTILLALLIELAALSALGHYLPGVVALAEGIARLLSIIIVVTLINNSRHLSSDIMWILLIILVPAFGTLLYLFLGTSLITSKTTLSLVKSQYEAKKYLRQDPQVLQAAEDRNKELKGQLHYISASEGYPVYRNRQFDYYPSGEEGYPHMLEEMRRAEHFIFLEYFIIEEGKMWDGMLEILQEKAQQGLDVRVMYDDMGSLQTLPSSYAKKLESMGIRCVRFNKINPVLSSIMNHRDHRKIMVIDGKTAFSGGVNLADEYINEKEKFGYWKDTVIRIKGEAVWSYIVLFLTNWNALRPTDSDWNVFKDGFKVKETEESAEPVKTGNANTSDVFPARASLDSLYESSDRSEDDLSDASSDGFIAPYGETPLDDQHTGQDIYMNILNSSNHYCYIFTPYLIIDTELENALILAARRGVDIRIITPGIPDKKMIWRITRSFYKNLINGGVKIYEYTPGFDHAKVFVSDDRLAAVGTINLDYRSLYLHFENGTLLYDSKEIPAIRDDLLAAVKVSRLMEVKDVKVNVFTSMFIGIAKLFASEM
ncbi:MAG: phospholipase D-like domain-containing protein [Eubacterium sp.]|nr:phospholipase D-like domain-containing protein [Eubacterium sp.]